MAMISVTKHTISSGILNIYFDYLFYIVAKDKLMCCRYLTRASILTSVVGKDGTEALKAAILDQVLDCNLNVAFFEWFMSCKIGSKSIAEYLWRNMTTSVDNGIKKVSFILKQPFGDVARFLPFELIKIYKKDKEKKIFEGVKKLFFDSIMFPSGCFDEHALVELDAIDRLDLDQISTCGIFRNFFNEMASAEE